MPRQRLPRLFFKNTPGAWAHWIGLGAFLLIVFGPAAALTLEALPFLLRNSGQWFQFAVPMGRRLDLFIHSVGLALCVAAGGTLLGILVGSVLWRWRKPGGITLRWIAVLLFAVPPYVHALAWMTVINGLEAIARPMGLHVVSPEGWVAAWWVEVMALTPIGIGMTLLGLESVETRLLEAARLMGPEIDAVLKIALPLAKPMVLAGAGFMFLISLADYTVPSLFQVNVYALEIFAEYSASGEPATAFLLALPLVLTTVLVLFFSQSYLRRAALKPIRHIQPWPVSPERPTWLRWAQGFALALIAAQILVPLIGLTLFVGTWGNLSDAADSARNEILFTFRISLLTAAIALPVGLAAARELAKASRSSRLWWFLVTAPLALPAPLIGVGLIALWNRPLPLDVYGSFLMPVLASLARFTPLAALVLFAQLRRIDPLLLDAARIFQTCKLKTWGQIHFPMLAPGLLASACITLVLSAGELGATLLVASPGQGTLTMRIYNYLHYGASERVAGLCLIMALCALFAGVLAAFTLRGWRHFFFRSSKR